MFYLYCLCNICDENILILYPEKLAQIIICRHRKNGIIKKSYR